RRRRGGGSPGAAQGDEEGGQAGPDQERGQEVAREEVGDRQAHPQVRLTRGQEAWRCGTPTARRRGKRRTRLVAAAPMCSGSSQPQSHSWGSLPARNDGHGSNRTESARNTMASILRSRGLIGGVP